MANTKTRAYSIYNTKAANIDAHYGPWESIEAYMAWLSGTIGVSAPMDGTTIAVKGSDGGIVKYVWENDAFRKDVVADGELSDSSENPLQNKVVKEELDKKQDVITESSISRDKLDADVKTSLDKADSALQEHQDIRGKLDIAAATETYATKEELTTKIATLAGLEGSNFMGIFDTLDKAKAAYVDSVGWALVGSNISALEAYRVDSAESAVKIGETVYDFTDYSELKSTVTLLETHVKIAEDVYPSDIFSISEGAEFVYVKVDDKNKVLLGIRVDGTVYFGAGVPPQIQSYVLNSISSGTSALHGDVELIKVGLESIEGRIAHNSEMNEYIQLTIDKSNKIITGVKEDGTMYIPKLSSPVIDEINNTKVDKENGKELVIGDTFSLDNNEYLSVTITPENKVITAIHADGSVYIGKLRNSDIDALYKKAETLQSTDTAIYRELSKTKEALEDNESRTDKAVTSNEFIHSVVDKNQAVIEGIRPDGTAVHNTNHVFNDGIMVDGSLDMSNGAMSDLKRLLKESGFSSGAGDWSSHLTNDGKDPLCLPEPRCAVVNIKSTFNLKNLSKVGRTGAIEGVNYDIPTEIEFYDMQGNYFKKWTLMSGQGNSSMAFEKKNIAFDLFDTSVDDGDAFGIKFGDWVPQDSFHLKAYYTDAFRGVSVVAYKLFKQICLSRGITSDFAWKKGRVNLDKIGYTADGVTDINDATLQTDTGATCFPDGFPCIVYQNGEFWGIYSWQLKKHRKNMMQEKANANHIHLDGTIGADTLFNANGDKTKIGWVADDTGFEVRNPKSDNLFLQSDGSSYDSDLNSGEIMGEDSPYYNSTNKKHKICASVKKSILKLSKVNNVLETAYTTYTSSSKTDADVVAFKKVFETYFDIDNLIDYMIISDIIKNSDGYLKNWQWFTYDGTKWFIGIYDCDVSFGGHWTGKSLSAPQTTPIVWNTYNARWLYKYLIGTGSDKTMALYLPDVKNRYKELRDAKIIDTNNIMSIANSWLNRIGEVNFEKEWKKWSDCPCNSTTKVNDNWELVTDDSGKAVIYWDNEYSGTKLYNAGDVCCYGFSYCVKYKYRAKVQTIGVAPVADDDFGYKDNIYRLYNWISQSIQNMDNVYKYNK